MTTRLNSLKIPNDLRPFRLTILGVIGLSWLAPTQVHAQSPLPTNPRPRPDTTEKPAGVAEKAPDGPELLPTTPILPALKPRRKAFELQELDGYFRFRADWFKNFHMGFDDTEGAGGAPFARPAACGDASSGAPCEETLKTSNIRLRLRPRINVNEYTSVHVELDVFDNLILGSTPIGNDGLTGSDDLPLRAFSDTQGSPQAGINANSDSIRVKRAWAEVHNPGLGVLKVGRQPVHWGLGIFANSGGYDPIHDVWDLDGDFGDTVDRLMIATKIPGTDYDVGVGMDWAATTPSAAHTDIFRNRFGGQPWDLDDNDDVNQWVISLSRMDSPKRFRERVDQGELAVNYGIYFLYRTQNWETVRESGDDGDISRFHDRDAKAYIPDLWFRLGYGKLSLEIEGVAVIGGVDNLTDQGVNQSIDFRQFGGVARLGYKLIDDKLNLGFEVGFASGDQYDNDPEGSIHIRNATRLPECTAADTCDSTISQFAFDPDYKVDMILFRELMGAVTNATYLKPSASYDITGQIKGSLASIISLANQPIATPGNSTFYGVELNADVSYTSGAFSAGIAYGVLFPLAALSHPETIADDGGMGFGFGPTNTGSAETAQTIQSRVSVQF